MPPEPQSPSALRVGEYVYLRESGELVGEGARVLLARQPRCVLEALIDADGHVVRRDALVRALWPHHPQLDTDCGLNAAVHKLRIALGDTQHPFRYVETLPRIGYRLIASITPRTEKRDAEDSSRPRVPPHAGRAWGNRRAVEISAVTVAALLAFTALTLVLHGWPQRIDKPLEVDAPRASTPQGAGVVVRVMPFVQVGLDPADAQLSALVERDLRNRVRAALGGPSRQSDTGQELRTVQVAGKLERTGERLLYSLHLAESGASDEIWEMAVQRTSAELAEQHRVFAGDLLDALERYGAAADAPQPR